MNEFVAKKLGEVLAFSRIGLECKDRAGIAFSEAIGEAADKFQTELTNIAGQVEAKGNEITTAKAEKTTEKLRGMMEAYIGDEWDNPTEVLEWLSFFLGAAAAHWSLVKGAAETLDDNELATTAESAKTFYHDTLHTVIEKLHAVGASKASA